MADGGPSHGEADGKDDGLQPGGAPPPPLASIRVKGKTGKGLNKPAVIIGAGGAIALVLVLASGGLTSDPQRRPAEIKPLMSDPARPEMAQGALGDLPRTYEEAAIRQAATQQAQPPLLGPPLPGDVAAFAPDVTSHVWAEPERSGPDDGYGQAAGKADLEAREAELAPRSALFFDLRHSPRQAGLAPQQAEPAAQRPAPAPGPLTALGPAPDQQQPAPPSQRSSGRALHPGAIIPASLITAIDSEAAGPVIAQVTHAIYDSATGRTLLIPQGARLIGDYTSAARYGKSRIAILWSRLIMPDGEEIVLDEAAVDPSGAAGVKGKVDNHWREVFGAAALGTLISIGAAASEETPILTYGGIGVVSGADPVEDALADGVKRTASIVTNRVVDRSLAIPPTIRVEAGKRISVIVTRRTDL